MRRMITARRRLCWHRSACDGEIWGSDCPKIMSTCYLSMMCRLPCLCVCSLFMSMSVCLCYVSSSMSMCLLTVNVYVIAHMTQLLSLSTQLTPVICPCRLTVSSCCVMLVSWLCVVSHCRCYASLLCVVTMHSYFQVKSSLSSHVIFIYIVLLTM